MARRTRALRTLAGLVERGLVDEGDIDEFLSLYAAAFDARGIAVGKAFGFHPWNAQQDIPSEWIDIHTRYRDTDKAAPFLARAPIGKPYIPRKHLTSKEWDSPLMRGLGDCGFTDAIIQRFATPWNEDMYFAVYRPKGARHVSGADEALVYWLYPNVAGALATRSALRVIEGADSDGGRYSPDGHAFVTFPRLAVEWSRAARTTLTRTLGPMSRGEWPRVERMVVRAATDFRNGTIGARSRVLVPQLRAELAWVPPKPGETHRALVMFFRERHHSMSTAMCFELLSPAQRGVAELAASGATNSEIAEALGVAFETVRTHLREIYRRLGVSGRTELARLVGDAFPH